MTREQIVEAIEIYGIGEEGGVLLADGLDGALVGFTDDGRAVYSRELCADIMVQQGLEPDEAWEYLEFNTFCAYVGEKTPLYIHTPRWENE